MSGLRPGVPTLPADSCVLAERLWKASGKASLAASHLANASQRALDGGEHAQDLTEAVTLLVDALGLLGGRLEGAPGLREQPDASGVPGDPHA